MPSRLLIRPRTLQGQHITDSHQIIDSHTSPTHTKHQTLHQITKAQSAFVRRAHKGVPDIIGAPSWRKVSSSTAETLPLCCACVIKQMIYDYDDNDNERKRPDVYDAARVRASKHISCRNQRAHDDEAAVANMHARKGSGWARDVETQQRTTKCADFRLLRVTLGARGGPGTRRGPGPSDGRRARPLLLTPPGRAERWPPPRLLAAATVI